MREWFLRIAEIAIAIRSGDDRFDFQFDDATAKFLVDACPPEVSFDVRRMAPELDRESGTGELLFDSGYVWKMFRRPGGYRVECTSEPLSDTPYKYAYFDESFTRGTVAIDTDVIAPTISPLEYPLDELLVANLLGRGRGVELHSCGIIDHEGRGHLFVGQSGAGKTTTALLWEGAARDIISDDRVIIRARDGELRMYGTPWHGEAMFSSPASVPLTGIYLLKQATTNALIALDPATAVARLFACTFPQFHDPTAVAYTVDMLGQIAATVPVRELRFTRDRAAVDLVLKLGSHLEKQLNDR